MNPQPLPPLDAAQRYEIREAARYLRISRSKLYQDIAAKRIAVLRDGCRVFVPGSEIVRCSTIAA